jgi:hypothetical protein
MTASGPDSFEIVRDGFAAGSSSYLDVLTTEQSLVALDAEVASTGRRTHTEADWSVQGARRRVARGSRAGTPSRLIGSGKRVALVRLTQCSIRHRIEVMTPCLRY